MVDEVIRAKVGICFDVNALARSKILNSALKATKGNEGVWGIGYEDPDPFASREFVSQVPGNGSSDVDTASQTSEASMRADAVQPIHDGLTLTPLWWLLEIIPLSYTYQDGAGVWHKNFG